MSILWIVILVGVIVASLVVVLTPLLQPAAPWDRGGTSVVERVLEEKALVLRSLKDLEEDRQGGFLTEEEYQGAREEYMTRAVQLNRDLTRLTGIDPTHGSPSGEPAEETPE